MCLTSRRPGKLLTVADMFALKSRLDPEWTTQVSNINTLAGNIIIEIAVGGNKGIYNIIYTRI